MSVQDRIPAELWLEIWDLLPQDAIRALSLTSHTLRLILRRLLFAHFDFHTWTPTAEDSSTLIDDAKLDCYLERLAFFSCDSIAPLVRSCSITSWQPMRLLAPAGVTFSETLLAAFVEHLPRFTGLQRLFAEDVDFKLTVEPILRRFPALERLDVDGCKFDAGPHIPPLPNIRHLAVKRSWMDDIQTLAFMSKFPNAKALEFSCDRPLRDWLGMQQIFPLLREYSGPFYTLGAFLPLPTLTCLTMESCGPRSAARETRDF